MRISEWLEESAMFIGMCIVCGVGIVIASAIVVGGFAVISVLLEKYLPLIKEVLL